MLNGLACPSISLQNLLPSTSPSPNSSSSKTTPTKSSPSKVHAMALTTTASTLPNGTNSIEPNTTMIPSNMKKINTLMKIHRSSYRKYRPLLM